MKIEKLWIKTAANPIKKLFVSFVFLIPNCLEKGLVTPGSTAVLRRTVPLAFNANRSSRISLILFDDPFDSNLMLPTIAEIIFISNRIAYSRRKPCEAIPIFAFSTVNLKLRIGIAVGANDEFVKMTVGPADCGLNHVVELCERDAAWDQHIAPNGGLDIEQLDLQLIDLQSYRLFVQIHLKLTPLAILLLLFKLYSTCFELVENLRRFF